MTQAADALRAYQRAINRIAGYFEYQINDFWSVSRPRTYLEARAEVYKIIDDLAGELKIIAQSG